MDWQTKLKSLGHEGDQAYVALMEFFEKNPRERLSTHRMGQLGLRYFQKGEWHAFNQATLERKARDLASFGLLVSTKHNGFVYFRLPEGEVAPKKKIEWKVEMRDGVPVRVPVVV